MSKRNILFTKNIIFNNECVRHAQIMKTLNICLNWVIYDLNAKPTFIQLNANKVRGLKKRSFSFFRIRGHSFRRGICPHLHGIEICGISAVKLKAKNFPANFPSTKPRSCLIMEMILKFCRIYKFANAAICQGWSIAEQSFSGTFCQPSVIYLVKSGFIPLFVGNEESRLQIIVPRISMHFCVVNKCWNLMYQSVFERSQQTNLFALFVYGKN